MEVDLRSIRFGVPKGGAMNFCPPAARVVVATSGSPASDAAVTVAADAATHRGPPLEIVHVLPPTMPAGPYVEPVDLVMRRSGREVLTRAEAAVRRRYPDLDVSSTLLIGSRVDALLHHAEGADLLVVGAPPHDLLGRLWTGSTVYGVAARAACPVLVVPAGPLPPTSHEVLVALKSARHAGALLATAFSLAQQRHAELRVLHVWHRGSPYDEAISHRLGDAAWTEEQAIDGLLGDLRLAFSDVPALVEVVQGQPAFTLATESKDADLLVISRPAHGGLFHRLGATARAVIREAACPVLVVPPSYDVELQRVVPE